MSSSSRQHATVEEIVAEIKAQEAIAESIEQQIKFRSDRKGAEHEAWVIRARDKRAYTLKAIADLKKRLGGNDPSASEPAVDSNSQILREHNVLLSSRVAELTSRVAELESENDNLTARLRAATATRS